MLDQEEARDIRWAANRSMAMSDEVPPPLGMKPVMRW